MATGRTSHTDEQESPNSELILDRLTLISRSLGILALRLSTARRKSDAEQVNYLETLGFERDDIAAMLALSPKSVRDQIYRHRKAKGRSKGSRGKD
jgi:hypothetical protein